MVVRRQVRAYTCHSATQSQHLRENKELTKKLFLIHLLELILEKLDIIQEPQVRHVENNEFVQRRKVTMIERSDVVKIRFIFLI